MTTLVLPMGRVSASWIRYAAIALSLVLHGLLVASYGGNPASQSKVENQSVTRLSFLTPEAVPLKAPEVVPEIKPEKPKVKPRPEPVREVVKKNVVKKAAEPVREVVEAVLHEVVEEVVTQPEPVAVAVAHTATVAEPAEQQIDEGLIKRETEHYLTAVMAHIERHKWYPKAARRRGIEGEVNVSFTLFPDGSARQLVVENGPSLLLAAARKAVEEAIPMPTPPASIHCPLECQFRMQFNLKTS